ncbi:MAG: hypothetical protein IAG13_37150 [Deltaproteobacteria bacterium]|nr:hypothetical protein [Nannocystaceae bacterium]
MLSRDSDGAAIGLLDARIDRSVRETSSTHIDDALLRAQGIADGVLDLRELD